MSKITQEELDGLRALCEAATQGQVTAVIVKHIQGFTDRPCFGVGMTHPEKESVFKVLAVTGIQGADDEKESTINSFYIEAMWNALPRLLDALAAAQKEIDRLREGLRPFVEVYERKEASLREMVGDSKTANVAICVPITAYQTARALLGEEAGDE